MPCNSLLILQAFSSIPAAECSSHVPSIDRHPRGRQNSIQFYSSRCSECCTRDLQNNFSCKGRLGTMRMSCNGCRVLRKRCSDSCALRPCLQWIKGSESQANATVFLAKFYGRAGLMNLINSGPEHLRPSIFRSLLYEACGRMVNPTYGSVGLLLSGKWQICQSAVESILRGSYPSRLHIIDQAVSRSPLRANKVHNIRSNVRFKRSASTRHSTLGDGDDHLDPSNATSDIRNLRWRRCHHPVRTAELPGSCSQISSDCSAESHDIGDIRSRSFQIVTNENGRENDMDAHNGKANAKDLMGIQAEIDSRSSEVRSFENDTCNELGIKEEIRDNHSLELELRLGSQNCYTSSNSTLPQPASYNSSRPPNSSCTDPSPFVTSLGLGLSPPA